MFLIMSAAKPFVLSAHEQEDEKVKSKKAKVKSGFLNFDV